MKKFHLFVCDHYYPTGFSDYVGSFVTWDEAITEAGTRKTDYNFAEICWTADDGSLTTMTHP